MSGDGQLRERMGRPSFVFLFMNYDYCDLCLLFFPSFLHLHREHVQQTEAVRQEGCFAGKNGGNRIADGSALTSVLFAVM